MSGDVDHEQVLRTPRAFLSTTLGTAVVVVAIAWLASGVVREHCMELEGSELRAESHWTLVLWPPGPFAATNPDGRCLRNHPVREALGATGLWELEPAKEQLEDHYGEQLEKTRQY